MVEVIYEGRLGNNLFQYCFGRILAENLGYKLKADPIPGFPNTKALVDGHDYSGYETQALSMHIVDLDSVIKDKSKRKILLNKGFFQRYEYYKPYKNLIKNDWLLIDIEVNDRIEPDDVVVCIRRDDYVSGGYALPFSYYKEALSRLRYRKIFVCTDSVNDPFISLFKLKYNAVVRPTNTLDTFKLISLFSKIIISNSTFYWWAAFLSNAKEIYSPLPLRGYWSRETPEIDLKIGDEDRYIYMKCKDIYKENLAEKLIKLKRKVCSKLECLKS
jgi:hypothetical protein